MRLVMPKKIMVSKRRGLCSWSSVRVNIHVGTTMQSTPPITIINLEKCLRIFFDISKNLYFSRSQIFSALGK